ncbi:MAG: hypothetical protein ACRENV_08585, partial [Candidatus Dormibacteria bacterium]
LRALPRHPAAALGALDALARLPRSLGERRAILGERRVEPEAIAAWARPTPWRRLLRPGTARH